MTLILKAFCGLSLLAIANVLLTREATINKRLYKEAARRSRHASVSRIGVGVDVIHFRLECRRERCPSRMIATWPERVTRDERPGFAAHVL